MNEILKIKFDEIQDWKIKHENMKTEYNELEKKHLDTINTNSELKNQLDNTNQSNIINYNFY